MYSSEITNQFIELRSRGIPYADLAARLNINRNTAIRWAQKHKPQIDALAAIEADAGAR